MGEAIPLTGDIPEAVPEAVEIDLAALPHESDNLCVNQRLTSAHVSPGMNRPDFIGGSGR
jgi:hypothetical protein